VRAITDKNFLGIIKSEETKPGIFIGNCLVKPEEYACPVSIINITEEPIEIITPLVTLSEIQVRNRMSVFTLQTSDNAESIQARRECLNKQLRLEHLNNEEKKAIEEFCEDFCDIFHLEDDDIYNSGSARNHHKCK